MPLIPHFLAPKKALPFMRYRFMFFGFSILLTLATVASLSIQGLNLGVDFTGGAVVDVRSETEIDLAAMRASLEEAGIEEATIQGFDLGRAATIRLPAESGVADAGAAVEGEEPPADGGALNAEQIRASVVAALGPDYEVGRPDVLGAKVSGEYLQASFWAVGLAILGIAIYVWFRFEFKFGIATMVTLAHDVLTVFLFFSISRMTFDMTVVAAVLTVAGYTVNDTVVIFDRIRENLRRYKSTPLQEIIDRSVTETLPRTFITVTTVAITTLALLFWGGPVMRGFAAAMTVGLVIGTYSSIFVAAPLLIYVPGKLPGDSEERRAAGAALKAAP